MEHKLSKSAQHGGAESYTECSESTDMSTLARRIDSSLNSSITDLLKEVTFFNSILQFISSVNLVPVGSSQDGSKVNVPGDGGDVDILLISNTAVINESLLEYESRYPAFLRVRGDDTHSKLFESKRLVEDKYVPVKVLKNLERRIYGVMRFFVSNISLPGISADGKHLKTFKESAVGLEIAELDGSSIMDALHMAEVHEPSVNVWSMTLKMVHDLLDALDSMGPEGDPRDLCFTHRQKSFSNVAEGVTSAVKKIADLSRDRDDDKGDLKMRNEMKEREPKTDPIYRSSLSHEIGETTELPKLMTADIVPAFTIQGWPRVAKEWITRHRKWPSNNLVLNIVETGCQIVAKRPLYPELHGDRNNEDHSQEVDENDTCFRLSFSQCELALAKQLSEVPLLCWKILKAYQKAFLRTEPPVLTSYHWKTVLFWIREDTDDDFWSEGNLLNCVTKALDFMINCLEDRFLPVFFVRGENLIAGCRDDLVVVTLNKVAEIRKAPRKYLSIFLEDPPKPEVYKMSKEKIKEYLSAESYGNMIEDTINNMMHGLWYSHLSMLLDISKCAEKSSKDGYDSMMRRLTDVIRHSFQLFGGERTTHSAQLIVTGLESLMETVFTLIEDIDTKESDSENEQVIYSIEQSKTHTTQQESQIWDMPSNANVQNDQTRTTNDSFTAQANENPRTCTTEDIADDKETSAVASSKSTEPSDNSWCTEKVDVKLNGYPQQIENAADYQSTNADSSNKLTKQKDDSFSRTVEAGVKLLNKFVRIVSKEHQESDEGKRESDSGLLRVAGQCAGNWIHLIKGQSMNSSEQHFFTGLESLMENVCTLIKDKDSTELDCENEQVIYSREQSKKYTTRQESQVCDIPSNANVQNDRTRTTNDSFTVQANEHPRTTEYIADDKETHAFASSKSTEPPDNSLNTIKVDVERNEYPKQVKEIPDNQSTNAEMSKESTKQKDDSVSRKVKAGVKLNDFVRLVSEEDQESDVGERESGSGFLGFAGNFIRTFQNQLSDENDKNYDNTTNSAKRNKSSRAPCD